MKRRAVEWGFLAYALSCFASTVWKLRGAIVIDDAFILYRYAALGGWNSSGPPVEGYSSPLWVLALQTPWDVPTVSVALCLLSSLGALLGLFLVTRSPFAVGLLAMQPAFAVWAVGGMEHALATALVVFALWVREKPRLMALALFLLAEVRTEGALFLVAWLVVHRGRARYAWLAVGALVAHELFRLGYYGLAFPLPVYRKALPFSNAPMVWDFVRLNMPLVLIAGWYFRKWEAFSVGLALVAVSCADGSMGVHFRYFLWLLPILIVSSLRVRSPFAWVVLALGSLATDRGGMERAVLEYSDGVKASHLALAKWLPKGHYLAATGDAGIIPFYTLGVDWIDLEGLNTPRLGGVVEVFEREPLIIVLRPPHWDGAIYADPRLGEFYDEWQTFEGFYTLKVYKRKGASIDARGSQ